MKRPSGVILIASLTFFAAAILALGSLAFFFVAYLGMTGGATADPASIAIAGMGAARGFSLLVLASLASCLAMGVLDLSEWARLASIASIATGIACTILSLFALKGYLFLPLVPSILCHLLLLAAAAWMLSYLSRPQIKQAFAA